MSEDLGTEMCAVYRAVGIFAHENPVRAVADRIEALEPAWMHAMHGGSLTAEAIPGYTRALREQRFAYEGKLLGREVVRSQANLLKPLGSREPARGSANRGGNPPTLRHFLPRPTRFMRRRPRAPLSLIVPSGTTGGPARRVAWQQRSLFSARSLR